MPLKGQERGMTRLTWRRKASLCGGQNSWEGKPVAGRLVAKRDEGLDPSDGIGVGSLWDRSPALHPRLGSISTGCLKQGRTALVYGYVH